MSIEHVETLDGGATHRFAVPATRVGFMEMLAGDADLSAELTRVIVGSGFDAVAWETPVLSAATAELPAEFVVVDAPDLAGRSVDGRPFADLLAQADPDEPLVVCDNLGGDARMVIPAARPAGLGWPDLAAFLRAAPAGQIAAIWQAAGQLALDELRLGPRWLSTAGGGVAWLHVRLDEAPKYYRHGPYRRAG